MGEAGETVELVVVLRGIVREQEKKILQLESDIRVWERKYKHSLFGEGGGGKGKKEVEVQQLRKGLVVIEEQYRGVPIGQSLKQTASFEDSGLLEATVRLVSQLCSKVQGAEQEVTRQGGILQEQALMLEQKTIDLKQANDRVQQQRNKADSEAQRAHQESKKVHELQQKIDAFQREFTKAKTQAEQYQSKLLAEIQRLSARR